MNGSSFITFFTYMLLQNSIRFYKGLYVTFKLAPDLKVSWDSFGFGSGQILRYSGRGVKMAVFGD